MTPTTQRSMAYRPRHDQSQVPVYWCAVLCRMMGTSAKLACALWHAYTELYPFTSQAVRFQLDLMPCPVRTRADAEQRVRHLERLLPPKHLFAASLRLAPAGKAPAEGCGAV